MARSREIVFLANEEADSPWAVKGVTLPQLGQYLALGSIFAPIAYPVDYFSLLGELKFIILFIALQAGTEY